MFLWKKKNDTGKYQPIAFQKSIKRINEQIKKIRSLLNKTLLSEPGNLNDNKAVAELTKNLESLLEKRNGIKRDNETIYIQNILSENKKILTELNNESFIKKITSIDFVESTLSDVIKDL